MTKARDLISGPGFFILGLGFIVGGTSTESECGFRKRHMHAEGAEADRYPFHVAGFSSGQQLVGRQKNPNAPPPESTAIAARAHSRFFFFGGAAGGTDATTD